VFDINVTDGAEQYPDRKRRVSDHGSTVATTDLRNTKVAKVNDLQRQILDFEGQWWLLRGNKETAIHNQFELSAIRYTQLLNRLLDDPEAVEYSPTVVSRLRRIRDTRQRERER
jgi:hypothetical protein